MIDLSLDGTEHTQSLDAGPATSLDMEQKGNPGRGSSDSFIAYARLLNKIFATADELASTHGVDKVGFQVICPVT